MHVSGLRPDAGTPLGGVHGLLRERRWLLPLLLLGEDTGGEKGSYFCGTWGERDYYPCLRLLPTKPRSIEYRGKLDEKKQLASVRTLQHHTSDHRVGLACVHIS